MKQKIQVGNISLQHFMQKPKIRAGAVFFALATILGGAHYINTSQGSVQATGSSFSFGTGGDHGNHAESEAVFQAAANSGLSFFQTNGDLGYYESNANFPAANNTQSWCNMVNNKLGTVPFLALSGNHEEPSKEGVNGDNIDTVISGGCLPKPASMNVVESPHKTGNAGTADTNYGREYYYDYPAVNPLARVIAISASVNTYQAGFYDYATSSSSYNWVKAAIQQAKADGLWVIVVNHHPFINTGSSHGATDADTDTYVKDVFNMAIAEKADLILSGHDHNYQRTKQLKNNIAGCTTFSQNQYNSNCISNGAATGYTAGEGAVIVLTGSTGGNEKDGNMINDINTSDPDYPYFAKVMGSNTGNQTFGFSKFDITSTSITGSYVPGVGQTGGFTDNFTITRSAPADTTKPTVNLVSPAVDAVLTNDAVITANASDNVGVTKVEFWANSTKLGESTSPFTHTWDTKSVANGSYSLTAKAFDAAGNSETSSAVVVTVNNSTTPNNGGEESTFTISNMQDNTATGSVTLSGACATVKASSAVAVPAALKAHGNAIAAFDFTATCTVSGGTANVQLELGKQYTDLTKLVVIKSQADGSNKDITKDVTAKNHQVNGKMHTVITYSATDGAADDMDAATNGEVVDPVYVFEASAGAQGVDTDADSSTSEDKTLADTGNSAYAISIVGLGLTIGYLAVRRLSK